MSTISRITLRFSVTSDEDLIILKHKLGRSFSTVLTECIYAYINHIPYVISKAAMIHPVPKELKDIKVSYGPSNQMVQDYFKTIAPGKKSHLVKYLLRRANPYSCAATNPSLMQEMNDDGVVTPAESIDPSYFQLNEEDRLIQEKQKELEALLRKRKERSGRIEHKLESEKSVETIRKTTTERVGKTLPETDHIPEAEPERETTNTSKSNNLFGMASKMFDEY